MEKPRIIVSNDDGINSPGLKAAVEAVLELGEVIVVAPTHQQTGAGRALTGDKESSLQPVDFSVKGVQVKAYHCDCSPALVVKHSLRTLFRDKYPDLLVSGINYGENMGIGITSSGTVGAALEGGSLGIPSIAISKETEIEAHYNYTEQDWQTTIYFLHYFSKLLLQGKMMKDVDVLKIDVPQNATIETEWKLTKVAPCGYYSRVIDKPNEHTPLSAGNVKIIIDEDKLEKNTDIHTLAIQRLVSVAPISADLSSRVDLEELKKLYE